MLLRRKGSVSGLGALLAGVSRLTITTSWRHMRFAILLLFLMPASQLLGQVSTGALSGYVLDPSDRSVPGAVVTLQSVGRSVLRSAHTDLTGFYLFEELARSEEHTSELQSL